MNSNVQWQKHDVPGVWVGEAKGFREGIDPTVTIMGGVHGDEQTGIEVVNQSLDSLNIEAGRVFLAHGNLDAMKAEPKVKGQKGRRFTENGVNLNRSFRELTTEEAQTDPDELPYEVRRGQELLSVLRGSQALLDLHDFTHDNEPFIITEERGFPVAKAIGAPVISSGWSEQEPGGSDGFMETLERIGICYELGRKDKPKENIERGHGAVSRFLIAMEMFEGDLPPLFSEQGKPRFIFNERAFIRRTNDYELYLPEGTKNFTPLEEGQLIARLDGQDIRAQRGQVPIFPMKREEVDLGTEAFSLGREIKSAA